jgi:hypothetical protein
VEDYLIPVGTVLQSNLVSFNAVPVNDQYVQATWQTAGEANIETFVVERSRDGAGWSPVQALSPHAGGDSVNNYAVTDPAPYAGVSYYRLKMVAYSGNTGYSTIAKVTFRSGAFNFTVTPNPFKSTLSLVVTMPAAGPVTARLIDTYGNIVYTGSFQGNQGSNTVNLNGLPDIAKGIYILEVSNGQSTQRSKVLKE